MGTPDGKTVLKEVVRGNDSVQVGKQAAELLIEQGAKDIVERVKEEME